MKLGGIYVWETDKAKGHTVRRKFHIYICEAGWRAEGHAFLFISSSDYGGDYRIDQTDYGFLTKEASFVSCGGIVTYSEEELQAANPQLVGTFSEKHLTELFDAIAASETMEQWQIKLCCEALKVAFY